MTHVADEELGKIARQYHDLFRRVREGSLDAHLVSEGLQGVIEGKYPRGMLIAESHHEYAATYRLPAWWCTPEQQLERARQLWPGIALPEPPKEFVPRTSTEVLLLHVPDVFDSLWNKVDAPAGYIKYRTELVKSDKRHLRLAPNVPNRTEPVWLAFDYAANQGKAPDTLWGQSNLAASEVLPALIQFPDWSQSWNGTDSPYPNLSGYQLKYDNRWSVVPCLGRWDVDRQLGLDGYWADSANDFWSSPVVREC